MELQVLVMSFDVSEACQQLCTILVRESISNCLFLGRLLWACVNINTAGGQCDLWPSAAAGDYTRQLLPERRIGLRPVLVDTGVWSTRRRSDWAFHKWSTVTQLLRCVAENDVKLLGYGWTPRRLSKNSWQGRLSKCQHRNAPLRSSLLMMMMSWRTDHGVMGSRAGMVGEAGRRKRKEEEWRATKVEVKRVEE